jgi:hypothetical protein
MLTLEIKMKNLKNLKLISQFKKKLKFQNIYSALWKKKDTNQQKK